MLGGFGSTGEQPGLALVLESKALSFDAGDGRVVKDASRIAAVSTLSPAEALSKLRHPAAIRARMCAAGCVRP